MLCIYTVKHKVKLVTTVKKYFCFNEKYNRTTFAEPLNFVEDHGIRTKRLNDYIDSVGLKNSSVEAEKQIKSSHVNISNNTILRIVKRRNNFKL